MPLGNVTWIVSVVWVFTWPGTGDGVMIIVGSGTGITVTVVEVVAEFPAVSVSVPVTVYVPAFWYTCDTFVLALTEPRSCALPSPHSM